VHLQLLQLLGVWVALGVIELDIWVVFEGILLILFELDLLLDGELDALLLPLLLLSLEDLFHVLDQVYLNHLEVSIDHLFNILDPSD